MAKVTGEGSIQALDKPERTCRRWRLWVRTGYDPVTKRYERQSKIFRGTKTEARSALRDFIAEVNSGLKLKLAKATFKEYSDQWLEERRLSGEISKGTQRKNEESLAIINRYIANVSLSDLDSDNISRLLITIRSNGGKNVKEYSGATMHGIYRVLNQVLESARKRKIIAVNPCEDVKAPKIDTKEKDAMTTSEARRLAAVLLEGHPESRTIGFLLALTCGLRREEVCGLRWCDFDPVLGCLRVEHAYASDGLELTAPKTDSSRRTIPLTTETLERLKEWKRVQAVDFLQRGFSQTSSTAVLSTSDGGHMHPANFARAWGRYSKSHGFEGYTLHQLRHTFATRLVANGVDLKTAATLMGHSSVAMLEKIYAHYVPENATKAMATLGNDLFGDNSAPIMPFEDIKKAV